jgi:hypothetical protein
MPAHPTSEDVLEVAIAAFEAHGRNVSAAARALGVPRPTMQARLRVASRRGLLGFHPVMPGYEVHRTSTRYDADGQIVGQTIGTRPEAEDVFTVPDGHVIKGVSTLVGPDGRVSAQWVKTREGTDPAALRDALIEALSDYTLPTIDGPEHAEDDLLTVYVLPDLHLGMLAWGQESGENYDLKSASDMARAAVTALVAQSRPSRNALLLGLGDYFHANDRTAATPASGHRLDVDGRWRKVLRTGAQVAVDMVSSIAQRHDTVMVRFLPGNHDPDASDALTVATAMFFSQNPRVMVDERPGAHFYHQHGSCLIGATHGHTMKPERMALMLAADQPQAWGSTRHRHMLFGHVHHESLKEVGAVRVESFSSPAAKDAYAAAGGWRSGRALVAITYHKEHGEIGRHRVNL